MINKVELEKSLKRYIKRKKIGYSITLLISFLISGSLSFATEISDKDINLQIENYKREIESKLKENNKRLEEIEKEVMELIKEGDHYAKTLENHKQFFFPLTIEHRHSGKSHGSGFALDDNVPNKPTDPENPDPENPDPENPDPENPDPENPDPENPDPENPDPENPDPENPDPENPDPENPDPENPDPENPDPENPDPENPDPENPDPENPDPENPDPENPDPEPTKPDIHIPEEQPPVTPNIPNVPKISIVTPEFDIDRTNMPEISFGHDSIKPFEPEMNLDVKNINDIEVNVGGINFTPPSPNTDPTEAKPTDIIENPIGVIAHEVVATYAPRFITEPEKFKTQKLEAPSDIALPVIDVKAGAFGQGGGGITAGTKSLNDSDVGTNYKNQGTIIENFSSYKPKGEEFSLTFKTGAGNHGDMEYTGTMTVGKFTNNQNKGDIDINKSSEKGDYHFRNNFGDYSKSNTAAFISDTRMGYTKVSGKYNVNFKDDKNSYDQVRIFLSLNPAGVLKPSQYNTGTDGIQKNNNGGVLEKYNIDGSAFIGNDSNDINAAARYIKKLTLEKDTIVNLDNETQKGVLVGLDHQTWDTTEEKDGENDDPSKNKEKRSYSILESYADINLKEGSKHMLGIMMDVEHSTEIGNTINSSTKSEQGTKTYNHKTLNRGSVNINGTESVGISFEEARDGWNTDFNLKMDLYAGNINFGENSSSNYGLRMGNIMRDKTGLSLNDTDIKQYYDRVRVYGNGTINDNTGEVTLTGEKTASINVTGKNNAGVTVAKSLSDSAAGYLNDAGIKSNNYSLGYANYRDEILDKNLEDLENKKTAKDGYAVGEVNPIANIHGLVINVDGDQNIGFLRDRDYSDNNKNDMIIQENGEGKDAGKEAITDIKFGANATNSVLIRSDKYGIVVEKNLDLREEKSEEEAQAEEIHKRNVVLQATADDWERKELSGTTTKMHSVGTITNKGIIQGDSNLIGMMASGYASAGNEEVGDKASKIVNNNTIELYGKNNIGMAVLQDNTGKLIGKEAPTKESIENAAKVVTLENAAEPLAGEISSENQENYNLGIYNEGIFTIENAVIKTDGKNSVGLYNIETENKDNSNKKTSASVTIENADIVVGRGAVGIYSIGGSIKSGSKDGENITAGNLRVIATGTSETEQDVQGIYAADGAKIEIYGKAPTEKEITVNAGGEDKTHTVRENYENEVRVENGAVGVAAVGEGTDIILENTDIWYGGNGYGLYTDDSGAKISSLKGSSLNLMGKAFGMKLDITKDSNGNYAEQPINLGGLKINVGSDEATVFNLVSKEKGKKYNLSALLSGIGEEVRKATGGTDGTDGFDIWKDITPLIDVSLYKVAIVDGGELTIDKSIAHGQKNEAVSGENKEDKDFADFYFKRFLGQRLKIDVAANVSVDGTMSGEYSDKYFNGYVIGLEVNSSSYAKDNKEASLTLIEGASIVANRLNDAKDEKKNIGAIGAYANYAIVKLENESSIIVEKEITDKETFEKWNEINGEGTQEITADKVYENAVGIFGVNSTDITLEEKSNVNVYGDKGVGIYSQTYRYENGKLMKDEFGENAKDQGKINIVNSGFITMSGDGSVGIYTENNREDRDKTKVNITNNGTITVGNVYGTGNDRVSSVGIYADAATVKNEKGKIIVGNEKIKEDQGKAGAIGIYLKDSTLTGQGLGEMTLGSYATGIDVQAGSDITATGNIKFSSAEGVKNERMGVVYSGVEKNTTWSNANYNIDMSEVVGGKALVVREGSLEFVGSGEANKDRTIKINGENSRGIRIYTGGSVKIAEGSRIIVGNEKDTEITKDKSSIGILAKEKDGSVENNGIVEVNSKYGIGIYLTKENTITGTGKIELNGANTTGVYLDGKDANIVEGNAFSSIVFGNNSKDTIGIFSKDNTFTIGENKEISNKQAGEKSEGIGNTLIYAENAKIINNGTVVVAGNFAKEPEVGKGESRDIGVYLDKDSSYKGGNIISEEGAIGLYANEDSTVEKLGNLTVDSKNITTIGALLKNKKETDVTGTVLTLTNTEDSGHTDENGNEEKGSISKSLGIYADATDIKVTDTLEIKYRLEKDGKIYGSNGTGIYLENGAKVTGNGTISITGQGIENSTIMSNGILYSETAGNENNAKLQITKDNAIGINTYLDLTNNGDILIGKDNTKQDKIIGLYTKGNTVTQNGKIEISKDATNSVGIYALDNGDKKGNITLASGEVIVNTVGKINNNNIEDTGVGIYNESGTVTIENGAKVSSQGTYSIGIDSEGTVINSGIIEAGSDSVGAYIHGEGAKYNGATGKIITSKKEDSDNVAIGVYLIDGADIGTGLGEVTLGEKGMAVYAHNTTIDGATFSDSKKDENGRGIIEVTSDSKAGSVTMGASSGMKIGEDGNIKTQEIKNINISAVKGSTALYLQDAGVNISNVEVNAVADLENEDTMSTGIYLEDCNIQGEHKDAPYKIDGSTVNIKKGIGIFVNSNNEAKHDTELSLTDTKVNVDSYLEANVDGKEVETGIGIYLKGSSKLLTSEKNIYTVKEGIGIYGEKDSVISIGGNYNLATNKFTDSTEENKDTINLYGYSVGAFTDEGKIYIGENVKTTFNLKDKGEESSTSISGSLAYANNGDIENHSSITLENTTEKPVNFFSAIMGVYDQNNKNSIVNTGNITLKGTDSVAIAAIKKEDITNGLSSENLIDNKGDITISGVDNTKGKMAVGIYSSAAGIENTGAINIGERAVGIGYSAEGYNINSTGDITLNGTLGIGVNLTGTADNITFNNITSKNVANVLGVNIEGLKGIKEDTATEIKLNEISLGDDSLALYIKNKVNEKTGEVIKATNVKVTAEKISVGDSIASKDNPEGVVAVAINGEDTIVDLTGVKQITAGLGGTAIYNVGGTVTIDRVGKDSNGVEKLKVGEAKVYGENKHIFGALVYSEGITNNDKTSGEVKVNEYSDITVNGSFGLVVKNGGKIEIGSGETERHNSMTVKNGGTGLAVIGTGNTLRTRLEKIYVKGNEKGELKSTGVYYKDAKDSFNKELSRHNIVQSGEHTTGIILDNSYSDDLSVGDKGITIGILDEEQGTKNSIGIIIRNNYNNSSTLKVDMNESDTNETLKEKQLIDVAGLNNIAIVGRNSDLNTVGKIKVEALNREKDEDYLMGVYLKSDDSVSSYKGLGDLSVGNSSVGIYGEKYNITYTGNMELGDNESIGIVQRDDGDVTYTGDITVGDNKSIALYTENGSAKFTVNEGNMTIGKGSYGIVAKNDIMTHKEKEIEILNKSNINLSDSAIGIYSSGWGKVTNNGNIKVGGASKDDKTYSVGIYMSSEWQKQVDGTPKDAEGYNTGTITVDKEGAIGVHAAGHVTFHNTGTINVDNGATGMYATQGATIINEEAGKIILGNGYGEDSINVGMRALGSDIGETTIINRGTIDVNAGVGMYIENGAKLENTGEINVFNGYGIGGIGDFTNKGTINLKSETAVDIMPNDEESENKIISISDGIATIGSKYANLGGIINSDYSLKLDNPLIDITTGNGLGFNAPDIKGDVRIASNFALTGNGYSYKVEDFYTGDVDINVNSSFLFKPEKVEDDLILTKVPYKDLVKDSGKDNMYDGLDDLLVNGKDLDILKNINNYLGGTDSKEEFAKRYETVMSQIEGNIYTNVQSRMQDINRSFANAFDEMESSYNLSKDTDKFSVIYTNGDYKNSKAGVAEYEYNIAGLLYMKEYEGEVFGDKHGYTLGFTGSRFKFEESSGSKENIYSLRAGVHNVKDFGNKLDLITKAHVGLNYHDTERKFLGGLKNDADFMSYYVGLENRFRKTLYETYENEFGMYAGLDLEYGRFDDIKEDGDLRLKVKANDYLKSEAKVGFNGTGRKYLGKDWTLKLTGDVGYSYDFGENYKENEAKLRDSSKGYYSLMSEVEKRGAVGGKIGVGFERLNHLGVTLEGEVQHDIARDEDYWNVGLRFNYKFNNEDIVTTLNNVFNLLGNNFDFDKSDIRERDRKILEKGSDIMNKHNLKGTLTIEGHTDSRGTEAYNQVLSEKRAKATENELRKNIQKPENINYSTKGYGELRPIKSNDTDEGRAANRRSEVKFKRGNNK